MGRPELIVLSGPQGSGKSTWVREQVGDSHVRINLDMLRSQNRENILLHACLAGGISAVVDRTNPTRAQRRRYLDLAQASGFKATLVVFQVSLQTALARNASRSGRARVPDVAIRGTLAKLETVDPAAPWDEVRVVPEAGGSHAWVTDQAEELE